MTATPSAPKSVLLYGATGTIGRATAQAVLDAGHHVTCAVRPGSDVSGLPEDAVKTIVNFDEGPVLPSHPFSCVISCLASRTGSPDDAWRVDHDLNLRILEAAKAHGIPQFVLLSAICVQKPLLEFQKAKLAFEEALKASGLTYSIVRPTAFFKSLSGQVKRVQTGRPFLLFGDGRLTACKPISDRDLGRYLTQCLDQPALQNVILPIGGPGAAMTPRAQGEMLFDVAGRDPAFRSLPIWVMDAIIAGLTIGGRISQSLRKKAELARIGRYYATESMLVLTESGYSAEATPSFGADTLRDHYVAVLDGRVAADLGDHAVF